jgi:uncharacterized membrane protein YtjA (UPF0391 family)
MSYILSEAVPTAWATLPLHCVFKQPEAPAMEGHKMLHYAVVFLVIALIAALLGFTGIAAGAAGIAKILFVVFLIFAIATFIFGRTRNT